MARHRRHVACDCRAGREPEHRGARERRRSASTDLFGRVRLDAGIGRRSPSARRASGRRSTLLTTATTPPPPIISKRARIADCSRTICRCCRATRFTSRASSASRAWPGSRRAQPSTPNPSMPRIRARLPSSPEVRHSSRPFAWPRALSAAPARSRVHIFRILRCSTSSSERGSRHGCRAAVRSRAPARLPLPLACVPLSLMAQAACAATAAPADNTSPQHAASEPHRSRPWS